MRIDRWTFVILCNMLRTTDHLASTQCVDVQEMVAIFLHILSHDVKNRVVERQFAQYDETISRDFRSVLTAVLQLQKLLLKKSEPIMSDCTDNRWKWFENCLGALDDIYIKVKVNVADHPRYRTRKGWEGSAVDSRVLRDAISRPHGLKFPKGYYYLCDTGYPNIEGFLAPHRGEQYHLSEWCAREISQTTTSRTTDDEDSTSNELGDENIQFIETSDEWTSFRDELATRMFDEWEQAS
ncbi:uncharacterized protein LOC120077199 [Benincasa hispida]|uniref:uncharacterized protein LOC120077199 n=1 Tax=Benincasa hispida TaxID=102211 RepID=UPI0019005E86|nr:uncharacterized protein LOC120077199 [Benincasa hispida]